jgi:hypothetical protein
MARLFHTGFEGGSVTADAALFGWSSTLGTLSASIATTGQRSGKACLSLTGGGGYSWLPASLASSDTNTYYLRVCAYLSSANTSIKFFGIDDASFAGVEVQFDSSGHLIVCNNGTSTPLGSSTPISTGSWHVIELSWLPNTGAYVLRLDGTQVDSGTGSTSSNGTLFWYLWGLPTLLVDDVALNDSTGSYCNSWPGAGQIVLQPAASDNSRTGFLAGGSGGGTTNLYAAVDNTPPVGVVYASATSTSQISDATSNTTDNYVANLETYTAAGVPSGASIVCQQAIASIGASGTTSQTTGLTVESNPSGGSEATSTTGTTASGTWPTDWTTLTTAIVYGPTVTLGTAPTVKLRKGTATTQASMSAFMGLLTEYLPSAIPTAAGSFFLA